MKTTQWLMLTVLLIGVTTTCRKEDSVPSTTETTASATVSAPSTETTQPVSDVETDPDVLTAPPPMDASAPEGTPRYALEDAAARGLVEYEVHGTDASSGDSLILGIRRLNDSDLDVYIVPGTVFVPGNSDAQRMVAWSVVRGGVASDSMSPGDLEDVTSMYLPDMQPRAYMVEAYCLDFELENPAPADAFQPRLAEPAQTAQAALAPDFRAAELIREGKRQGLSVAGIQVALWADHNHTKEEIVTKFDAATAEEMDKAFEMVLNAPPPKKRQ